MEDKKCGRCLETKPVSEFPSRGGASGTLRGECKACMRAPLPFIGPLPYGKVCNRCEVLKPMEDFHKAGRGKYGRNAICKACKNEQQQKSRDPEYNKKYYAANRERLIAYQRAYTNSSEGQAVRRRRYDERRADPAQRALDVQRQAEWRKRNPWKRKGQTLKSRYGITPEELAERIASQGGKCASCGDGFTEDKLTHIDHDHSCCPGKKSCGKCVRGILCYRCNLALGLMKDDPDRLRKASFYLIQYELKKGRTSALNGLGDLRSAFETHLTSDR